MSCMCRSAESEKRPVSASAPRPFAAGHKPIPVSSISDDLDEPGSGGGSAAPAPSAAPAIKKTVSIYPINVAGSVRDPYADAKTANTIWAQCGVKINMLIGQCWDTDVLDKLDPKGSLNEFASATSPTAEETALLDHHPGGKDTIHAYYVPKMTKSRGENFRKSTSPNGVRAVIVSDADAETDTFAHELGHVLMDDGKHHSDPDNLMCKGAARNIGVDKLDATQCGKI